MIHVKEVQDQFLAQFERVERTAADGNGAWLLPTRKAAFARLGVPHSFLPLAHTVDLGPIRLPEGLPLGVPQPGRNLGREPLIRGGDADRCPGSDLPCCILAAPRPFGPRVDERIPDDQAAALTDQLPADVVPDEMGAPALGAGVLIVGGE